MQQDIEIQAVIKVSGKIMIRSWKYDDLPQANIYKSDFTTWESGIELDDDEKAKLFRLWKETNRQILTNVLGWDEDQLSDLELRLIGE